MQEHIQKFNVIRVSTYYKDGPVDWHEPMRFTLELITRWEQKYGALVPKLTARFGRHECNIKGIGVGLHGTCLAVIVEAPSDYTHFPLSEEVEALKIYTDTPSRDGISTEDIMKVAEEHKFLKRS